MIDDALNDDSEDNSSKKGRVEFNYEKKKIFGRIEISKNWEIQVTLTSWNQRKPKYEIRKWKKDGTPGKGVTCTKKQFQQLIEIMNDMEPFNLDKKIVKNDIVENAAGQRGKVKKVEKQYLLVKSSKDNEKWDVEKCVFIKKGKEIY